MDSRGEAKLALRTLPLTAMPVFCKECMCVGPNTLTTFLQEALSAG